MILYCCHRIVVFFNLLKYRTVLFEKKDNIYGFITAAKCFWIHLNYLK